MEINEYIQLTIQLANMKNPFYRSTLEIDLTPPR